MVNNKFVNTIETNKIYITRKKGPFKMRNISVST